MKTTPSIAIVIPAYKSRFSSKEKISLQQCFAVFEGKYPIIFAKPESLNLRPKIEEIVQTHHFEEISFANIHFKTLEQYNRLMLNPLFYKTFSNYDYILIYQFDAFVFKDELPLWCNKGYDYIGAPWLPKKKYDTPLYRTLLYLKNQIFPVLTLRSARRKSIHYKVGNGGLSLRNTHKLLELCQTFEQDIATFLQHKDSNHFNEDVFWGVYLPEKTDSLRIPDYKEALQFAFDVEPAICLDLNNGKLPFGCHGWNKKQMIRFWQPIIEKHLLFEPDTKDKEK